MGTLIHATAQRRASSARDGGLALHGLWRRWRQRVRMRAELREMDARALADIGLEFEAARREARKYFWQS